METAKAKIADHGLEMHLVDTEYTFDGSRVVLYFTADGRVDFRGGQDLASTLRTRVELRQIGVRDQAKLRRYWPVREALLRQFLEQFCRCQSRWRKIKPIS